MKKSMLWSVRFPLILAALAALSGDCRALPYFGTFTQTITGSNIPNVYVGSVYYGFYTYESDTMDGTFSTNWYPGNQTLNGYIFVPFATSVDTGWDIHNWGEGAEWSTLRNTSQVGTITVQNGIVTDFLWTHEIGGFYVRADMSSFHAISFYDQLYKDVYDPPIAGGSIVFAGGPRGPDSGSSFAMLALGLLGLGLTRGKGLKAGRSHR